MMSIRYFLLQYFIDENLIYIKLFQSHHLPDFWYYNSGLSKSFVFMIPVTLVGFVKVHISIKLENVKDSETPGY